MNIPFEPVPWSKTTTVDGTHNLQEAPFPHALQDLIKRLSYREGWHFSLRWRDRHQGCMGLTFEILVFAMDSDSDGQISVSHLFPVPPANYNEASWRRWLFEQIVLVERHEAMEFFKIDGAKPYHPNHGPGWDPYMVTELTTDMDRRTNFLGVVQDAEAS